MTKTLKCTCTRGIYSADCPIKDHRQSAEEIQSIWLSPGISDRLTLVERIADWYRALYDRLGNDDIYSPEANDVEELEELDEERLFDLYFQALYTRQLPGAINGDAPIEELALNDARRQLRWWANETK